MVTVREHETLEEFVGSFLQRDWGRLRASMDASRFGILAVRSLGCALYAREAARAMQDGCMFDGDQATLGPTGYQQGFGGS